MPRFKHTDYHALASYNPIFLDYLYKFENVSDLFSGNPYDKSSWSNIAKSLAAKKHPTSEILTPLRTFNLSLGADEYATTSLNDLGKGALAVLTGQQVGLFGGPLYTLYKAVSAVRLAANISEVLGSRVVPLFWMDTDDHDFVEVQKTHVLSKNYELSKVSLEEIEEEHGYPVGSRKVTGQITSLINHVSELLPETEFSADLFQKLSDCYEPGNTMAQAFGRWLLHMTRGSGLAIIDPSLRELKASGATLFEQELSSSPESSQLVLETSNRLSTNGYRPQATPNKLGPNLFYSNPRREPLKTPQKVAQKEYSRLLRDNPERFSPNVLLRPLFQDTLFPTIAYTAGPSELAYFSQLKDLYQHFDVTMPLIVPRASFTIIEQPQAKFIDRHDVEISKLKIDDESIFNKILKDQIPFGIENNLINARKSIEDTITGLERDMTALDQSLLPMLTSLRGKLLHNLKIVEAKGFKAVKRKHETLRQQFIRTRQALFPDFGLQERTLSALNYLNKYGWDFTKTIDSGTDASVKTHIYICEINGDNQTT